MLEANEEWRILLSRLAHLELRERTILVLRYGLEGESALTLKEIGRRLGVTREWVRKIEIRAIRKLHNEYAADTSSQPAHDCLPRSTRNLGGPQTEEGITSGSSSATPRPRCKSRAQTRSRLRFTRRAPSPAPAISSAL